MDHAEGPNSPQPRQGAGSTTPARPASPLSDPSLATFLEKSTTLQGGVAQLRRDGIDVVWGPANGGTYIEPGNRIVIDENAIGQGARIARSLSHEIGHHRFAEQPDPSSKQAYVSTLLRGEAAATLSNAQVRREILGRDGPDIGISGTGDRPQQYQTIADEHLSGRITRGAALSQIGEVFKTERPSIGPHANYELYYGAFYDTHIAPRQRRQGTPEPVVDNPAPNDGMQTSQRGHADHPLYRQIKAGVERLDADHGRTWDDASERMTASLFRLANENGMSQVDHVVLSKATDQAASGERVFLVQGALSDPAHHRASMVTMDAIGTPAAQSLEQVEALNRAHVQSNQQSFPQPNFQEQSPAQEGPSFSR